jgi:hypothetical protein
MLFGLEAQQQASISSTINLLDLILNRFSQTNQVCQAVWFWAAQQQASISSINLIDLILN